LHAAHQQALEFIGKAEAEIFVTQQHILNDPAIISAIHSAIKENLHNLERAVYDTYTSYEERFAQLSNDYFRQRSTDLSEIRQRLINYLYNARPGFKCSGHHKCNRGADSIIVAEELTAEMMIRMKLEEVLGIVTEHGGTSSHAAIIARSVGVPAVSGVRGIFDAVHCGMSMLVDGDAGVVYLNPSEHTVRTLIPAEPTAKERFCVLNTPQGMEVLANASLVEDVQQAAIVRADGIGLFRTEIVFMRAERLLNEMEQFNYYKQIVDIMGERPVTFRLLDIGGDKDLPFLRLEKEDNPTLGWRGSRFLLGNREVFNTQVKALLRLSTQRKVRILFPMVIDVNQLERLIEGVRSLMVTVESDAQNVELGAMFEVPSACMQATAILNQVEFASIGSNDLIQYLFAVDRNNEQVSQDYNPMHPVLWGVLEALSDAARLSGKSLSMCGEMAAREQVPSRLIDIGIKSVSVSPRLIPRVRNEMALFEPKVLDSGVVAL
jgi:phosphotransferase system enzyme I (PtsI)